VEVYRESEMTADDTLGHGFSDVVVATGATWRRDGVGRWHTTPVPMAEPASVLTPDDFFEGSAVLLERSSPSQVLVYDDDHYYLGGVLAELLAGHGHSVRVVTPAPLVSSWTANTLEIGAIQRRLLTAGVVLDPSRALVAVEPGEATLSCVFTGRKTAVAADLVLLVTARLPNDGLFIELESRRDEWAAHGVRSVRCVGDAWTPATIAAAVWSGRRYAEEFDGGLSTEKRYHFLREYTGLAEPSAGSTTPMPPEPPPGEQAPG